METTIGEFLRSRRDRVTPESVGLPAGAGRRVPGLRREEVALIAGVSPDYYVRLEQGRTAHVSDQVLDAVARALSLTAVEAEHLRNLARPRRGATASAPAVDRRASLSDASLTRLLDAMTNAPAILLDVRLDILAANHAAEAVFGIDAMDAPRNAARQLFLNPTARALYSDWETIARQTVAQLRLSAGRWPEDPGLRSLVGELAIGSPDFRVLWAAGEVQEKDGGVTRIVHPLVGPLEFDYHALAVTGASSKTLFTYVARPGTDTAASLAVLLSWTAADSATGPAVPSR